MKLKLTVDGKVYEVDVEVSEPEQPRPGYVPPSTAATTAAEPVERPQAGTEESVADESKVCRSPISGVVVRVMAAPGQEIEADAELMVLEAMKMETAITSPISGKIARINVQAGDSVQGRQVLVEFE